MIVQQEILRVLARAEATYASPLSSEAIGRCLKLTPSYVRRQVKVLIDRGLVFVRRGNGGGYYLRNGGGKDEAFDQWERAGDNRS